MNVNEIRTNLNNSEKSKWNFPLATEQVWANESSVKCTVSVMVQNVYRFGGVTSGSSVRTVGFDL